MQQVRDKQGEPVSTHVKLIRFVPGRESAPMPQQIVAVDVGKSGEIHVAP